MSTDVINKNLKILAIITLIIVISYTLIQIGSFFMNLVTIFGISIIVTYVLLVPVNYLEKFFDIILNGIAGLQTADKNLKIAEKEIELPNAVMFFVEKAIKLVQKATPFLQKRVLAIFTVYITFLFLIIFIAFQLIPPAIYQVGEFAGNIPSYAEKSINYINEKFPEIKIPGLSKVLEKDISTYNSAKKTVPIIIHDQPEGGKLISEYKEIPSITRDKAIERKRISKDQLTDIVKETAIKFQGDIKDFVQNNSQKAINNLVNVAAGTLTGIGYTVTIIVLSFYFLLDGKNLIKSINVLIPKGHIKKIIELENSIHNSLLGFLMGQVVLGILTGIFMLIVYVSTGVKYSLFLSFFLAIAEIIPVIGSSLGFIPAIIVMIFTLPLHKVILVWFIFFLFQTVKDNIIAPKIVGEIIGLHPVSVIFALWIGFQVAGFFGILFAIPVASVINVIISFIIKERTENKEAATEL